ncbi:MAG TPA: lipocalin-like domain-containing protein [Chloroflexota bacterium]
MTASRTQGRVASPLVGTWRLVRVQLRSTSGRSSPALFPAATGTLTYRPDGRMAVEIRNGPDGDPYLAFDGTYLSYLDPFAPTSDHVVHRIEARGDAEPAVSERSQRIQLRGDRLIWLGATTRASGQSWTAELVWERV